MSTATVAHPTNGTKPEALPHTLTPLGQKADRLLELRRRIKADQEEEQSLTSELVGTLRGLGLRALHGAGAVAILESRTTLKVDAELFHHAVGLDDRRAYDAMTVSVAAARRLLPEELLADISETAVTPVLRVEPRPLAAVRVVAGLNLAAAPEGAR